MAEQQTVALVTGASAGIGAEYCRQLAARADRIIATGRRGDRLQSLADELAGQTEVVPVAANLATREGQVRVIEALRQSGPVDYLINNAGFSTLGPFGATDLDVQREMVAVHVDATMALCRAAIPFMTQRGRGYIVNVSSLVAFSPFGSVAVYGATKAFLNHFSEAIQQELKGSGVRVQCLCPGYTRSDFHGRESMAAFDRAQVPEAMWMEADEVVSESLAALALADGPVIFVPGDGNRDLARAGLGRALERMDRESD